MTRYLIVGRLSEREWVAEIEAHLRAVRPDVTAEDWNSDARAEGVEVPSILDVYRLRDVASQVEGRGPSLGGRFPSLPLLPLSIWIPVDLPAPKVPLFETKIDPVGLGSSQALRRELDALKPFVETVAGPLDGRVQRDGVAAVWLALHRAAELSIARRTAMMGFPDDPPR